MPIDIQLPRSPSLAGIALTLQGMSFNFPGPTPVFFLSNGVTGTLGY